MCGDTVLLQQHDSPVAAGNVQRGRKAVQSAADDDVVVAHRSVSASSCVPRGGSTAGERRPVWPQRRRSAGANCRSKNSMNSAWRGPTWVRMMWS
jgi:hypothetical protein